MLTSDNLDEYLGKTVTVTSLRDDVRDLQAGVVALKTSQESGFGRIEALLTNVDASREARRPTADVDVGTAPFVGMLDATRPAVTLDMHENFCKSFEITAATLLCVDNPLVLWPFAAWWHTM